MIKIKVECDLDKVKVQPYINQLKVNKDKYLHLGSSMKWAHDLEVGCSKNSEDFGQSKA